MPLAPLGVWAGVWLVRRVSSSWFYRLAYTGMALTGDRHASGAQGAAQAEITPSWSVHAVPLVASGFPRYQHERISISRDVWLEPVSEEVWNFHVGGHQVCRKWLKDRRGRTLAAPDLATYIRIVSAIRRTKASSRRLNPQMPHIGTTKTGRNLR